MPFDTTQNSYVALRKTLSERTRQVVIFCGAGLSQPAKLPSWAELRTGLVAAAKQQLGYRTENTKRDDALVKLAEAEPDYWKAFGHLKDMLGETTYSSEIRRLFERASAASPPKEYCELWRLPINGFVTLNLDGFTSRAFAEVYGGRKTFTELAGIDCDRHQDLLSTGQQFVVNLHGTLSQVKTWVFTEDDLEKLMRAQPYRLFLQSLFTTRTVLFIGITADDPAISTHLEFLKSSGFSGGEHYWITHRSDSATVRWADAHNVRRVFYSTPTNDHSEVRAIVEDIVRFFPVETEAPPVVPPVDKERGFVLAPPEEIERLTAEEIRQSLNKEASRILNSSDPAKEERYKDFWNKYGEAIHRAWSISTEAPKNRFMGYKVNRSLTKGGFGTIYDGEASDGSVVAIKVLHNVAKDDQATLQSFRRGVNAMRILSARKVDGMVPYQEAWEIPPCAVMEFIEGPNLQQAIEAKKIQTWGERLKVAIGLVTIIKAAHSVPEAVLHRDVRPANVMLSDLWIDETDFEVVVLDFDLAWHRDAVGHSVSLAHTFNGYLAPELAGVSPYSSRNALVDSYGIGMTLFFLVSGRAPLFGESQYGDWKNTLQKEVCGKASNELRSLGKRWARLVFWATKPKQQERWDVGRILGALTQLRTAFSDLTNNASAELFAEEILARSNEGSRTYEWEVDRLVGWFEIRTGFRIEVAGDESKKEITVSCDWMNVGDRKFENVKRYIGPAADRVDGTLRAGGWFVSDKRISTDSVHITSRISVEKLQRRGALESATSALDLSIEHLKLGNA